ncbi:MAG TPA: DUF1579 family protein [Planctomycetota bacterium]|nr:DUF1579 family protein [Planctomycetota bacterium]
MEMPKRTKEHEMMKGRAGTWDATVNVMGQVSKGTEKVTMLGPFWQIAEFQSEMMGAPFQGRQQLGYVPEKKEFFSTWIDTMSPRPLVMRGNFDAAGKVLTMTGEGKNMEGKSITWKTVVTISSPDATTFQMFENDAKQPVMTIDYKRRK